MLRAETDPEADPRFGTGFQKGWQIDPTPFRMKARAEKRKAKMAKKARIDKPMFLETTQSNQIGGMFDSEQPWDQFQTETMAGHEFTLLDWDLNPRQPALPDPYDDYDDEEDDTEEEPDTEEEQE